MLSLGLVHSLTVTRARLSDTCSYLMGHFSAFEIVEHAQPVSVFLIFNFCFA